MEASAPAEEPVPVEPPPPVEEPAAEVPPVEAPVAGAPQPPLDHAVVGDAPTAASAPFSSATPAPGRPPLGDPADTESGADRPELLVGAAFLGGLVLATVLKRLGR